MAYPLSSTPPIKSEPGFACGPSLVVWLIQSMLDISWNGHRTGVTLYFTMGEPYGRWTCRVRSSEKSLMPTQTFQGWFAFRADPPTPPIPHTATMQTYPKTAAFSSIPPVNSTRRTCRSGDMEIMGGEGRDDKCMAISSHWEAWGGREAFMYDLAIVDLLDGSQERLTSDAKFDLYPVWSPDGSKIAFINTRYSQADPRKSHVWVYAHPRAYSLEIATMNANGSGVRHIDSNFEGEGVMLHLSPPAWSPDGQYLAFMNGRISGFASIWPPSIGSKEIYVAREDGTDLVRIGKSTAPPSWSPSGDKLAYATYKTNYPSDGNSNMRCQTKRNRR